MTFQIHHASGTSRTRSWQNNTGNRNIRVLCPEDVCGVAVSFRADCTKLSHSGGGTAIKGRAGNWCGFGRLAIQNCNSAAIREDRDENLRSRCPLARHYITSLLLLHPARSPGNGRLQRSEVNGTTRTFNSTQAASRISVSHSDSITSPT
jgi:hypothetical protein